MPRTANFDEGIVIDERGHVLRRKDRNFGQLMRRPETVEEVEERDP